jgi:hypothetical protein
VAIDRFRQISLNLLFIAGGVSRGRLARRPADPLPTNAALLIAQRAAGRTAQCAVP